MFSGIIVLRFIIARFVFCRKEKGDGPESGNHPRMRRSVHDLLPGEAVLVEFLHEGSGIEFLHIEDAGALPGAGGEHHGADHGGDAGGVGDGLRAGLAEGFLVVADVVHEALDGLAVLGALQEAADAGLALGERAE